MLKVVNKLKEIRSKVDMNDRFKFDFSLKDESIFNSKEKEELDGKKIYDKNILLKKIVCEKYKKNADNSELDFWLINNWGGIKSFKSNKKNIKKIDRFKKEIKGCKSMLVDSFNTISSLSKVASFMSPEDFVIYDARVIYSLNWLIFSTNDSDLQNSNKYFPIPNGRNSKLSQYDMKTILNIGHNINLKGGEDELYYRKNVAYFEYCNFIKENVEEILGAGAKPYQLEMLLFVISEEEIYNEIIKLDFIK